MAVRDTVLLLVSVGRFGCFGYGDQPADKSTSRYPFEGAVYLSRYRVSLREFDGLLDLVATSSLRGSGRVIPAAISFVGAVYLSRYRVSLREFDGLLNLVAGSLREFRLVIVSIGRLNPPPPSVSVSPPPSKFAMSQPEIADRFPSPLQKPECDCLPVLRRNISSLKDAKYTEGIYSYNTIYGS
ncbi:hypothetical protein ASPNIDRAFT_39335 [Aspergillus niger ATCC 1015]|uniref:Uncharacterized protein n=1 Tax=Aspergillus niger (strain ATCC 1015 / CBS 113.46 / FGSC A1144 / LSHB Ac4 / NCTC 3858a / NRRL 328 / USDA 3528.7) TaxID=380704 RepID=G3YB48_ASPNA|nr:hypothetical protein ASPNIDRAFT_39335 [Aspergillus niger ATCC 1015]